MSVKRIFSELNEAESKHYTGYPRVSSKGWYYTPQKGNNNSYDIYHNGVVDANVDTKAEADEYIKNNIKPGEENYGLVESCNEDSEEMLYEDISYTPDEVGEVKTFDNKYDLASFNARLLSSKILHDKFKGDLKLHWMVQPTGELTGNCTLEGDIKERHKQNDDLKTYLEGLSKKLGYKITMSKDPKYERPTFEVHSAKLDEELLAESKVGNKEIEDDFYDTVCDKLGVDNLPGNAYFYKGHIIADVDGSWSVDGEGKFSTDKDAEKEVDDLNEESLSKKKKDFKDILLNNLDDMDISWSDSGDDLIGTAKYTTKDYKRSLEQEKNLKKNLESITSKYPITVTYKVSRDGVVTLTIKSKEVNEEGEPIEKPSKDLPQVDHVYWDKKHENAYYVVAVYPKDNKVSFWNMDNDRKQLTIDEFMKRYELSTNEDDYDLFEEVKDKEFFTVLNEAADKWEIGKILRDYLVKGLKGKEFHWKDNGEEADETDLLDYSSKGLRIRADEVKESDKLITDLEDLVDKWEDAEKYQVYVDWKDNVVDFKEED